MAYPTNWPEVDKKLKAFFPNPTERGLVRGRLLQLPEKQAFTMFHEEDAAVKASLTTLPGFSVVRDPSDKQLHCKAKVTGKSASFKGHLLLDTGCAMELSLSEYKAYQIGLIKTLDHTECETASDVIKISLRGWAQVRMWIKNDKGEEILAPPTWLEVWTDDDTAGPTPTTSPPASPPGSPSADAQLGPLDLEVEVSPVKAGKDSQDYDVIIGWPGMAKLGLTVDENGRVTKKKRTFRK